MISWPKLASGVRDETGWWEPWLGTATGLEGSGLARGLGGRASRGRDDETEFGAVMEEEGQLSWAGMARGGRDLGRLLLGRGCTAVPWAWWREGSGGAAPRECTGIGCRLLLSRLTGRGGSCWFMGWGPGDGWPGRFVEGLFPILGHDASNASSSSCCGCGVACDDETSTKEKVVGTWRFEFLLYLAWVIVPEPVNGRHNTAARPGFDAGVDCARGSRELKSRSWRGESTRSTLIRDSSGPPRQKATTRWEVRATHTCK